VVQLWVWGGVILSTGVWVRLWQVFVMEGVDNVCCNRDRWQLFNLVLANLDRMSALMFVGLGNVFDADLFKSGLNDRADQMVILQKDGVFNLEFVI